MRRVARRDGRFALRKDYVLVLLFVKYVSDKYADVPGASIDAGRDVQIVEKLSQGSDHPILLSFPESEYLKGLVCKVL